MTLVAAFEYGVRTRVVAHGAMLAVPFQQADPILSSIVGDGSGNLQVYWKPFVNIGV